MTKQEIIKTVNKNLGYNFNNGVIPYITDKGAEKLLEKIEQEKKEQAREIFGKIANTMPAYKYDKLSKAEKNLIRNDDFEYLFALNAIAKEYGVEL